MELFFGINVTSKIALNFEKNKTITTEKVKKKMEQKKLAEEVRKNKLRGFRSHSTENSWKDIARAGSFSIKGDQSIFTKCVLYRLLAASTYAIDEKRHWTLADVLSLVSVT